MSISIDNIANTYASNLHNTTNSLEDKLDKDFKTATEEELMDVCKEFEAYFTEQMFKAMQKMVPESSEEVSSSTKQLQDYYKEEMVKEFASQSVNGEGLGLAQILYEQMKHNYNL